MKNVKGRSGLADRVCVPCKGNVPPLKGEQLHRLRDQISDEWTVVDEHHLERDYRFRDFRSALEFTNRLGNLAEEQQHHPDILLSWGLVRVTLFTHKIDGLSENDFILAAKTDALPRTK